MKLYPDQTAASEISLGFLQGFRLHYTGPRQFLMSKNLSSAKQFKHEIMKKLQAEIQFGRILGPFSKLPISTLRISPIGVIPKSDGGWRLITDLSYPEGNSVNTYISSELSRVNYTSLDSILDKIHDLGTRAHLAKMDIKSAFRLLVINPADFDLMGIKFGDSYYIDKCLPMGCSLSYKLFETFSTFLQWEVERRSGSNLVDHYLDDFIFMGAEESNNCARMMSTFKEVCLDIGVAIADKKTMGPCTTWPFLGFLIDTEFMRILIPLEKLEKLRNMLKPLLLKKGHFERVGISGGFIVILFKGYSFIAGFYS